MSLTSDTWNVCICKQLGSISLYLQAHASVGSHSRSTSLRQSILYNYTSVYKLYNSE